MLAIHHRPGSFSDKWIEYCDAHNIQYKLVNCFSSDIIQKMEECWGLMWHWAHWDYQAILFARQLTYSLEMMGKKVFPDSNTCWHYDDKVGQKYLLEAIGAPLVPSYVFYDKQEALEWASKTTYPKVFKLRGGAGSQNVKLANTFADAKKMITKSFGRGYKYSDRLGLLNERLWRFKRDKNFSSFIALGKMIGRFFVPTSTEKNMPIQKKYAYFQDFIKGNNFDVRIVVVGKRAFAIRRFVRKDDFRASGSGKFSYDPCKVDGECVKIAFEISQNTNTQSLAYDFVFSEGKPLLVEISYAYTSVAYWKCPGYWDSSLNWKNKSVIPEFFIIEDFYNQNNH
jgi:hypothetical protein